MRQHMDEKLLDPQSSDCSYIKTTGLLFVLSISGGLGCECLSATCTAFCMQIVLAVTPVPVKLCREVCTGVFKNDTMTVEII